MKTTLTKDILKISIGLVIAILLFDAIGYEAWTLSGQKPADGFYLGAITASVLGPVR